ncbi:FliH/SctL family protein [Thermaurantiacus tibetensis]|uniref:FliH/SctL family protein n=1 Tax=Thermaurantiacus tibetensis TaxID=2759035 RepID=UPI00188F536D|nr:FliH/SctL family protein [Thermaurantiacus tibetensis]
MSEAGPPVRPVPLRLFLGGDAPPAEPPPPPPPDPEALFRDGFEAGVAAARAEAEAALAAAEERHRLERAAADAAAAALLDSLTDALAETALAVARAVLAGEPAVRPELVRRLVADVLAAAPAEARGRLHLHPEALPHLAGAEPPGWVLLGDPTLDRHEVRAELGSRQILASLAERLAHAAGELAGRA